MATDTKVKLIQPLPWRVVDGRVVDSNYFTVMRDVTTDEGEFICRAVNCHEDLLAALKVSRGQWIHSVNAEQCLAAIRKAEGD